MHKFETLIKTNNVVSTNRWYPQSVVKHKNNLLKGKFNLLSEQMRCNISYNLQYLEYIQFQLTELKLSDVMDRMLYKNYIITAMGIVECIFYQLLDSDNKIEKIEWGETKETGTRIMIENGYEVKVSLAIKKKLVICKKEEVSFERLIDRVKKNQYLSLCDEDYTNIKSLKKRRNKVHLQISEHQKDTDYLSINIQEYHLARHTLFKILKDDIFNPKEHSDSFDFMQLH